MLFLAWLLILMMMKMKSDAASAETITANSGEAVLLDSNVTWPVNNKWDFRWTVETLQLSHQLLTSKTDNRSCGGRCCELLANGSLRFSQVQTADAGNYSLEVFDKGGKLVMKKVILLRVDSRDTRDDGGSSGGSSVMVCVLTCCFLLTLLFIIFFILRRRKSPRLRTAGPPQENVYVVMHSSHSNEEKDEEEQQCPVEENAEVMMCDGKDEKNKTEQKSSYDPLEKNVYEMMHVTNKGEEEEEGKQQREQGSIYDPLEKNVYEMMHVFNKGKEEEEGKHQREQGSIYETPLTKQMSVDVEDIYV